MPRKSRDPRVVVIVPASGGKPAVLAVKVYEGRGICPGCLKEKELVAYTMRGLVPLVCSMDCRNRVLLELDGGPNVPTVWQARVYRSNARQKALQREKNRGKGHNVVQLQRRISRKVS